MFLFSFIDFTMDLNKFISEIGDSKIWFLIFAGLFVLFFLICAFKSVKRMIWVLILGILGLGLLFIVNPVFLRDVKIITDISNSLNKALTFEIGDIMSGSYDIIAPWLIANVVLWIFTFISLLMTLRALFKKKKKKAPKGAQQYNQASYAQPQQYGQAPYGQAPYAQPQQYGQVPYTQPQYAQPATRPVAPVPYAQPTPQPAYAPVAPVAAASAAPSKKEAKAQAKAQAKEAKAQAKQQPVQEQVQYTQPVAKPVYSQQPASQASTAPAARPAATVTRPVTPVARPVVGALDPKTAKKCPKCGRMNAQSNAMCTKCGEILK